MKSVLITGASTGFGRDTALAMARRGWLAFAGMRDPAKAGPLLDEARRIGAEDRVRIVRLDVTDPESIADALRTVLGQSGGGLDALLNNAGYTTVGCFEDLSDADCRKLIDTNFFGALAVTRAVLPVMRRAGRGRIVLITSNAVNTPHPLFSLYAASKWALEGWAEGLALELAPFGIDVTVLQPGAHRTPFAANVVPVLPERSAYARFMAAAAPGLQRLDRWGRSPEKATASIVRALTVSRPAFRRQVGPDTYLFALLKGLLPYRVRAWLVRKIVGFPGRGALQDR